MRQTLLVLLAMLLVTYVDYGQKRSYVRGQEAMVQDEVRRAAVGVAMEAMEVVYARAYDAATVGVPSDSNVAVSEFASEPFAGGNDCAAFGGSDACNAVEHFHDMVPATKTMAFPEGDMEFRVEIKVHYVDADMNRTDGTKTRWKEVVVRVKDVQPDGTSLIPEAIRFSEVHAYI